MEIPDRIDSKFRFVLLAANRAEQLMQGGRPRAEGAVAKPTIQAMKEIEDELVEWDYGPAPQPEVELVEGELGEMEPKLEELALLESGEEPEAQVS